MGLQRRFSASKNHADQTRYRQILRNEVGFWHFLAQSTVKEHFYFQKLIIFQFGMWYQDDSHGAELLSTCHSTIKACIDTGSRATIAGTSPDLPMNLSDGCLVFQIATNNQCEYWLLCYRYIDLQVTPVSNSRSLGYKSRSLSSLSLTFEMPKKSSITWRSERHEIHWIDMKRFAHNKNHTLVKRF